MKTINLSYRQAEIAANRRISQKELIKSIRFLKAMQCIYDKAIAKYDFALKTYQKLDLKYANLTKVTLCPSKAKGVKKVRKTIDKKIKTKKILAKIDVMSLDELTSMLNKLENKEI